MLQFDNINVTGSKYRLIKVGSLATNNLTRNWGNYLSAVLKVSLILENTLHCTVTHITYCRYRSRLRERKKPKFSERGLSRIKMNACKLNNIKQQGIFRLSGTQNFDGTGGKVGSNYKYTQHYKTTFLFLPDL